MEDKVVTPVSIGVKTDLTYEVEFEQGQLYTYLTCRFPVRSSNGSWYTMVVHSFNCNCGMPVTMKNRSSSEWLTAYGGVHQEFSSRGFTPKLQTVDNDASSALKIYLLENDVSYQLVPLHCHRCNAV
jgi:hypothetical protein